MQNIIDKLLTTGIYLASRIDDIEQTNLYCIYQLQIRILRKELLNAIKSNNYKINSK